MNTDTRDKLIENAGLIEKFHNLHPAEKDWLFPLLNRSIRTTVEMLELIAQERRSFEEIAGLINCHPQTVSQKINALIEGGMLIDLSAKGAIAPTGRPRKLARR